MEWFFLTLIVISSILFALTSFFDNYVTDTFFRGRRPEAQKVFTIFACLIALVILYFVSPPDALPMSIIIMTIIAGAINAIGSIFYYRALAKEETTGVAILLQFSPVLALISGTFILSEQIGIFQLLAIGLLLLAAALIIFSHGNRKSRLNLQIKTSLLLLVAMVFFVGSDTVFILSGEQFNFPTGFFYFLIGRIIVDTTLTLIFKSWRTRIKNVLREFRYRAVGVAFINETIDLSANLIWRIAILSVPIALATALENTVQLIATFLFGLVFTIIWPRFGREKLTKRTVSFHLLALVSSIIAILLIQFT